MDIPAIPIVDVRAVMPHDNLWTLYLDPDCSLEDFQAAVQAIYGEEIDDA